MGNTYDEIAGMLAKMIHHNTMYNVPRIGQVSKVDDPLMLSRILVHVPMLGWNTDDTGAWCYPKDKKTLITPKKDDYVLIEFIDGNRDLAVYSGLASNMKDMLPKNYESKDTQVLFESNEKDFFVKYNEKEKEYNINDFIKYNTKDQTLNINDYIQYDIGAGTIDLAGATESYVLGDTLKTELQKNVDALTTLQTNFSTWVPVPSDGGASLKAILATGFLTKPIASLLSILSTLIKGE